MPHLTPKRQFAGYLCFTGNVVEEREVLTINVRFAEWFVLV